MCVRKHFEVLAPLTFVLAAFQQWGRRFQALPLEVSPSSTAACTNTYRWRWGRLELPTEPQDQCQVDKCTSLCPYDALGLWPDCRPDKRSSDLLPHHHHHQGLCL